MPEFVNNSQVRPGIGAIAPRPSAPAAPVYDPSATVTNSSTPGATTAVPFAGGYSYDSKGRLLFEGFPTPFQPAGAVFVDAGGTSIPGELYARWTAAGAPDSSKFPPGVAGNAPAPVLPTHSTANGQVIRNTGDGGFAGTTLGGAGGTAKSLVPDDVIKDAWSQYVNGIDSGQKLRELLGLNPTDPLPTSIDTALNARDVKAIDAAGTITGRDVSSITGPQLGSAAIQEATTVQDYDTAGLREVAAGGGQLAEQVKAHNALAGMKATQTAAGIANQARDEERTAVRRAAALKGADLAFEGRLRATETLADKATQATTKLAELDAQKKDLQAQLDSARRNNDANRIQDITKKLADLELDVKKVNAEIDAGNASRDVEVQDKNIGNTIDVNTANANIDAGNADRDLNAQEGTANLSLQAQDQEEKQRIERARFRIEATKAIEDSAKGLLTEANRQATLALARKELAIAEARLQLNISQEERAARNQDRAFWAGVIGNLLTAVVPKPPGAAKGGLIAEPTLVAEGEHDELVIPVSGVSPAMRKALSVESQPFSQPVPVGALLKAAMGAQQPEPEQAMDWGRMMVVLAPANNRTRKVY